MDIETSLYNRHLSYVKDDIEMLFLPANVVIWGNVQESTWKREDIVRGQENDT